MKKREKHSHFLFNNFLMINNPLEIIHKKKMFDTCIWSSMWDLIGKPLSISELHICLGKSCTPALHCETNQSQVSFNDEIRFSLRGLIIRLFWLVIKQFFFMFNFVFINREQLSLIYFSFISLMCPLFKFKLSRKIQLQCYLWRA